MIFIKLIFILVLFIILILAFYIHKVSEIAFQKAFYAKRKDREYEVNRLKDWGLWDEEYIDSLDIEDVQILSSDNLKLKGHLIENHKESNRYVILVHGYTAHYSLHMPFIKVFDDEGFNVLLVEERAHGASEGEFATYGYMESKDLNLWIDFLEERRKEELFIGLHGQSMGAASSVICGANNEKVKFVVEDCGYSSAKEQFKYEFSRTKFANFKLVYWLLDLKYKARCGFEIEMADPKREVLKSSVPIFFVHGNMDKKVPCEMCVDMFECRKGHKDKILIVNGADHLQSYMKEPYKYKKMLHEFISEIE